MSRTEPLPWWSHFLLFPRAIRGALQRIVDSGHAEEVPNLWQIQLGVLRMWHRVLFRFDSIGTCTEHGVRSGILPRLLLFRPIRFPFLVAERAIAPFDFSGLASSTDRVVRHLLGAHHDGNQLVYDLELLEAVHPGTLERVRAEAAAVVDGTHPRAKWLRDLVVFEQYHEGLLAQVEQAIRGELRLPPREARDPDISFVAYLAWCCKQPSSPAETFAAWRDGRFTFAHGIAPIREVASC